MGESINSFQVSEGQGIERWFSIRKIPWSSWGNITNRFSRIAKLFFLKVGLAAIIWVIGGIFANPQSAKLRRSPLRFAPGGMRR